MLTISEIQNLFAKASSLVGDVPVILKTVEGDVETEFKALEVTIDAATGATPGTVTVTHGTPTVTVQVPADQVPAADPAAEAPAA